MNCNPQKVIDVALSQVGYKEKASNSQLYEKDANVGYDNWNKYANDIDTKYPDWYNGKKNGYDWCDIFVDWCFIQAYGKEDAQKLLCQPDNSCGAGCPWSYGYFKAKGQVGKSPRLGAQIFFGQTEDDIYHTGLVVGFDDSAVYAIEGNTGKDVNEVMKKSYARDNAYIYGYGYPAFDEVEPQPTPTPSGDSWTGKYPSLPSRGYYLTGDGYEKYVNKQPDIKLIQEYLNWAIDAKLVVDGMYGEATTNAVSRFQKIVDIWIDGSYGKETLEAAKNFKKSDPEPPKPEPEPAKDNEVKASQAAQSFDQRLAKTYTVNSRSGLNIRDGAGKSFDVLVAVPYGQKLQNYGYYSMNKGVKWLYIQTSYNGKTYIGFVSAQWLS